MKRGLSVAGSVGSTHHIQEVAHHFLQSTGHTVHPVSNPADGSTIVCRAPPAARHFAVAALEDEPASWVAAQLALTSAVPLATASSGPRPRVFLREWVRPVKSALAQVRHAIGGRPAPGTAAQTKVQTDIFRSTPGWQDLGAQRGCPGPAGGLELDLTGADGGSGESALRPQINWFHLGAVTPERLAELESAAFWCRGAGCPIGGKDGLVWCLTEAVAASWQAAYALGRLAAAVAPAQVKILLLLDEPSDRQRCLASERSPAKAEGAPASPIAGSALKSRCEMIHAAAGLPCSFEVLVAPQGERLGMQSETVLVFLRGVLTSLIQGAPGSCPPA